MHERNRNRNSTRNHNTAYNVVHPQCRGYVHKLCSIQLAIKPQFDLRTQLHILSVLKKLRTQLQVFPYNLLYKTLYAHSWDLTFPYKINLTSP